MRQKTLLQINVTANWGSTGKIAEEIGKTAMRHGWKSYIAYGRYSNPSANKLIRIGNRFDTFFILVSSVYLIMRGCALVELLVILSKR